MPAAVPKLKAPVSESVLPLAMVRVVLPMTGTASMAPFTFIEAPFERESESKSASACGSFESGPTERDVPDALRLPPGATVRF